jgi:hypothetical protein
MRTRHIHPLELGDPRRSTASAFAEFIERFEVGELRRSEAERRNSAGRKPWDTLARGEEVRAADLCDKVLQGIEYRGSPIPGGAKRIRAIQRSSRQVQ